MCAYMYTCIYECIPWYFFVWTAAHSFVGGAPMASEVLWRPLLALKDPKVLGCYSRLQACHGATIQPVSGLCDCLPEAFLEVLEVFVRQFFLEPPVCLE